MTHRADRIATIIGADSAATQALLATMVAGWRASGINVVGAITEAADLPEGTCSAGFLRDIATGTPYQIYLETPPRDTSCHLDAAGVEAACATIRDQVPGSDLVVLSKFGKLETARQGLANAFEAAVAAGKPVLTTVSDKHRDAWRVFVPDAVFLEADEAAIQDWWQTMRAGM